MTTTLVSGFISAYEKAVFDRQNIFLDPRCVPQYLEGDPIIGDAIEPPQYPDDDHAIWQLLYERQMALLPNRASEAYLKGVEVLGMTQTHIPALRDLSRALEKTTQWRIARIPGLLHEKDFFNLLAQRIFPCTDYIRGRSELDYTPAPDCFHDIFGHLPMLTNSYFADFYQKFGIASLNAKGQDRISLERLHWFCAEFGLIEEANGRRIFGAGVLSSKEEVLHALSEEALVLDFDPDKIIAQDYQVWHLQNTLFTHQSYQSLEQGFTNWCIKQGLLG
jgi:phenylalanine-4-hydroxylase